jgi:hypothetical protein
MLDHVTQTRGRATLILFATAAILAVVAVAMTEATRGEGANIGAGGLILLAMLVGLVATVLTVLQQQAGPDGTPALGRRTLTTIAVGAAATAALAAAVGQWPLAIAAAIPAVVCAAYAVRGRTA